jgi:hypothetical protein
MSSDECDRNRAEKTVDPIVYRADAPFLKIRVFESRFSDGSIRFLDLRLQISMTGSADYHARFNLIIDEYKDANRQCVRSTPDCKLPAIGTPAFFPTGSSVGSCFRLTTRLPDFESSIFSSTMRVFAG